MQHDLLVKSSDGDSTYVVQFILVAEKLSVYCSCSAGAFGRSCKHKLALLNGDRKLLFENGTNEGFDEVQVWIKRSAWPALLVALDSAEERYRVAKSEAEKIKKTIEAGMKNGL